MSIANDELPYSLEDPQGIVHLKYRAESMDDLINHYCVENGEIISDDFAYYIEDALPFFSHSLPLVLEVTGIELNEREQAKVEDAVWNHFHLRLCQTKQENRNQALRMLWFFLSLIISTILLLFVRSDMAILGIYLMYVPFWFFGYRVMDYIILQLVPRQKNVELCRQLANMKVLFSGTNPCGNFTEEQARSFIQEIEQNRRNPEDTDFHKVQRQYFSDDNTTEVDITIRQMEDVVSPHAVSGIELLSPDMDSFLEKLRPFVLENTQLILNFVGSPLTEMEQQTVVRCIKTNYGFFLAQANDTVRNSLKKIIFFLVCLVLTSVAVFFQSNDLDAATAEVITLVFWFFADYLVEYILIELFDNRSEQKSIQQFNDMEIRFS